MKYLRIKKFSKSKKKRKNGTVPMVPLVISKAHKYGVVLDEEALSRKQPILIFGAAHSGKSRFVRRLWEDALDIWGGHFRAEHRLWLCALRPLSSWYDEEAAVQAWYERVFRGKDGPSWARLPAYKKVDLLPEFLQRTRTVLFLDNAEKLAGRKLDVAKQCVVSAKIYVLAATQENRISPNLRTVVLAGEPQMIRLDSDASMDVTKVVVWFMILACLAAGAWEAAALLAGVRWLGVGRRAAKEE